MTVARCSAALLLLGSIAGAQAVRPIWSGKTGKYDVEWTAKDLRVRRSDGGKLVIAAAADAKTRWNKLAEDAKGVSLDAQYTYRVLSAAGPYLSIEKGEYCDCGGAHPSEAVQFLAIDLDKSSPGKWVAAPLTAIFPEQSIFAALSHDAVVAKALGSEKKPDSLAALIDVLQDATTKVKDCEFEFPPKLLTQFAIYNVKAGTAEIRLSLPPAAEVCRGQMTQLGLSLAIPERQRAVFSRAALLMSEARKMQGQTSFEFRQNAR
jgi:hypothetical protein